VTRVFLVIWCSFQHQTMRANATLPLPIWMVKQIWRWIIRAG